MKLVENIFCHMVPILQDNYVPVLWNQQTRQAIAIDPGTSREILQFLQEKESRLSHIILTHHHGDHIGGVAELVKQTGARVVGHQQDVHRLPALDSAVQEGDCFKWGEIEMQVMLLAGHTLGHIVYYSPQCGALFCGDVLFAMGCGRLFEGTPVQMFESLQRIKALPAETLIYCAHEYTENNGEFALKHDAQNEALQLRMQQVRQIRANGQATVPFTLVDELATNPFLRAQNVEEFTQLREARNHW